MSIASTAEVEVLEVLLEGVDLRTVTAIPFETELEEAAFILFGVESDGTKWAIGVIPMVANNYPAEPTPRGQYSA